MPVIRELLFLDSYRLFGYSVTWRSSIGGGVERDHFRSHPMPHGNIQCSCLVKDREMENGKMKKVLLLVLLLSMAMSANAGLSIIASKDVGSMFPVWSDWPNSKLVISPGDEIWIGVEDTTGDATSGAYALGMDSSDIFGPGALSADGVVSYAGVSVELTNDQLLAEQYGIEDGFITMVLEDPQTDLLFQKAIFRCEGEGDVRLVIYDDDGEFADDLIIHQVPEPATMVLLGLGGLLLRRKA